MKEVIFEKNCEIYRSTKCNGKTDLTLDFPKENYSPKHPFFTVEKNYWDKDTFEENFNNLLFSVSKEYFLVVVEKKDSKVSIKLFQGGNSRKVGNSWFKKTKNCFFLTVNTQTGNVYQGYIKNYQNKKKVSKQIRCNYFISNPLDDFQKKLKNVKNILPEISDEFYIRPIFEFIRLIDGRDDLKLSPNQRLHKFYLDKKQIKYPNNFYLYPELTFHPNFRKILKKNDMRLVDALMELYQIQGNKLKKALHQVESINLNNYKVVRNLFGDDWLNQDDNIIKNLISCEYHINLDERTTNRFFDQATKKEKKNAFNLLKNCILNSSVSSYTLVDHFRFWAELKMFGDTEVVWKSDGQSESFFRQEHLDWSDKLEHYKRGTYYRLYPKVFTEILKSFEVENQRYFPILLTNSNEYNEESAVQSNCVKGYIGRPGSLIISLRKNSPDSSERLTIEYRLMCPQKTIIPFIHRVQTLTKFNQLPSEEWNQSLKIVDDMMNDILSHKDFNLYKLKKVCSNGLELESDTEFDVKGFLKWSYEPIDSVNSYINFI